MVVIKGIVSFMKRQEVALLYSYLAIGMIALCITTIVNWQICHSKLSAIVSLLLPLSIIGLYFFFYVRQKKKTVSLETIVLLSIVLLGFFFMIILAPFTGHDEVRHFRASYKLSSVLLFQMTSDTTFIARADDLSMYFFDGRNGWTIFELNSDLYKQLLTYGSLFISDGSPVEVEEQYPFSYETDPWQLKFPTVLGISLARIIGLSPLAMFFVGRFFNLLSFAVLAYFTIKITPIGKKIFAVVFLLPMNLNLAASYSWDPLINGMTALLVALCLKSIYQQELIQAREIAPIAIVAILLAPCKVIYTLVVLLVFFIPQRRFSSPQFGWLFKFGICGLCVLVLLLIKAPALLSLAALDGPAIETFSDKTEPVHYSVFDIIRDPAAFFSLLLRSLNQDGDYYLSTMLGGTLASNQLSLSSPSWLLIIYILILVGSMIKEQSDNKTISVSFRMVSVSICLIVCLLAMTSMYLAATYNTSDVINGMQGRYFLPTLPLLMLACTVKNVVCKKDNSFKLVLIESFITALYLTWVFAKAMAL